MSDQYEKGVLKVLRYVYNQMERCRNADFDALGITSSQASVMMFLFKNRKHEVTQQSVQAALLLSHPTITGLMKRLEAKGFITQKQPCRFSLQVCQINEKRLRYRTRPQNQYEANAGQSTRWFESGRAG